MTGRFERRKRRVHLTRRDLGTIEAVFCARYLTNQMVQRLFYTPTTGSTCRQRLRYLFDAGYLRKRRAYPNEPDIYFLGLRGRRYIASLGEYSREEADRIAGVAGEGRAPMLMMEHELTLSTLYVNAVLECRKYGWELDWQNARMLERERLGVQPDAYIHLAGPTRTQAAFLEYTAVLPSRRELEGKLRRYVAFRETHRTVMVLWLTTSRHHLKRLAAAVREDLYRDWFLLGMIDQAGDYLTDPIWWHVERGSGVRFVTPDGGDVPAIRRTGDAG